jgi:hypothetical protein
MDGGHGQLARTALGAVVSSQLSALSGQHSGLRIQLNTFYRQRLKIVILSAGCAGFAPPESKDSYREQSFGIWHPTS